MSIRDSHMHTLLSFDGHNTAEQMVQAAILRGVKYVAFSEHHDLYLPYIPSQVALGRGGDFGKVDFNRHLAEIAELKKKYEGQIEIACGVEYGYIKEAEQDYKLLDNLPFDVIINSVHSAGYEDLYEPAYYEGKSKQETYELFLKEVWDSINAPYDWQILGHLGYVERMAKYPNKRMVWTDFPDLLDEILKKLARDGKALEVNSRTKSEQYLYGPDLSILKRFKEVGGEFVTFGSDAHEPETIGLKWDVTTSAISSAGFKYITAFMGKKARLFGI